MHGKEGKTLGFVVDPASKVYKFSQEGACEFSIVDRPPAYLLIQVDDRRHEALKGLLRDVFPVDPLMSRVVSTPNGRVEPLQGFRRVQIQSFPFL